MRVLRIVLFSICIVSAPVMAAEGPSLSVRPEGDRYLNAQGDTVVFILVASMDGKQKISAEVDYSISEDGARVIDEGKVKLENGRAELTGSLDRPGFLRCDATWIAGKDTVRAVAGCGFSVESIQPTSRLPEDFLRFWRQAAAELLRVPIDLQIEQVEPEDFAGAGQYKLSLASVKGGRVHGWLTIPPGSGPFPTVLVVPGAGVGRTGRAVSFAKEGVVVLSINVHGIEPDRKKEYYRQLNAELGQGWDYLWYGLSDPYQYYFRRVIQDCMRALDYLYSRVEVDTARVAVAGSSQGGYLSLMMAGIDKRVKGIIANVPGLCDHTGVLYGRASGGPQLLKPGAGEAEIRTLSYFDAALAARLIEVPAIIGVGFIDAVCPPTTVYAAYNNLRGEKAIENFYNVGHGSAPGWGERSRAWLLEKLNARVQYQN